MASTFHGLRFQATLWVLNHRPYYSAPKFIVVVGCAIARSIFSDKNEKCEERSVTIPALVSQHPYVSHERYQEMRNRHQNLRTPNETQRKPMTSAQQYGWWLPQDSKKTAESAYPWIECQRYPQLNSPMTQFVQQMCLTDKSFSLF